MVPVAFPSDLSSSAVAVRQSFPLNPDVSTEASPFSIVTIMVFMISLQSPAVDLAR